MRAQGGNSSLNIFDEVHTYGEDITESVNKGSRQKQDNWQSIYITSGGLKRDGLYDKLVERFKSEEEFYNDRSFGLLYMLENHEQVKDKRIGLWHYLLLVMFLSGQELLKSTNLLKETSVTE